MGAGTKEMDLFRRWLDERESRRRTIIRVIASGGIQIVCPRSAFRYSFRSLRSVKRRDQHSFNFFGKQKQFIKSILDQICSLQKSKPINTFPCFLECDMQF